MKRYNKKTKENKYVSEVTKSRRKQTRQRQENTKIIQMKNKTDQNEANQNHRNSKSYGREKLKQYHRWSENTDNQQTEKIEQN